MPHLRVLWQPNRGLGGARNAGIVQSRGRYLFALDADNVAEPEFVERAVELLEDDPSLAYVTCLDAATSTTQGRDLLDDLVDRLPAARQLHRARRRVQHGGRRRGGLAAATVRPRLPL